MKIDIYSFEDLGPLDQVYLVAMLRYIGKNESGTTIQSIQNYSKWPIAKCETLVDQGVQLDFLNIYISSPDSLEILLIISDWGKELLKAEDENSK